METAHVKPWTYIGVFVILGIVTFVEVLVSQMGLPPAALLIALLAMMTAKALLVAMFYMHLKYDTKTYSLSLVLPLFMAILLAIVVIIASRPAV